MTTAERVQKHRVQLEAQHRKRFEACVDVTVLKKISAVAQALKLPAREVIERALTDYGAEFDALIAEQRRLHEEHPRVVQYRSLSEVGAYNRDLKRYRERVTRFLRRQVGQTEQRVET